MRQLSALSLFLSLVDLKHREGRTNTQSWGFSPYTVFRLTCFSYPRIITLGKEVKQATLSPKCIQIIFALFNVSARSSNADHYRFSKKNSKTRKAFSLLSFIPDANFAARTKT